MYISASVALVLMTQSGTGKVCLGFLLLYVIVMKALHMFSQNDRVIALLLVSALLLPLIFIGTAYSAEVAHLFGKDLTLSGRTEIWRATMISVLKRPVLGYGYMAFWRGFQGEAANVSFANGWASVYAHSGFMELLTTTGVVGLGVFLVSFLRAVRDAAIGLRGNASPYLEWSLCIVLLTIILNVDEVTVMAPFHLLWILYIIACIGLAEISKSTRLGLDYG